MQASDTGYISALINEDKLCKDKAMPCSVFMQVGIQFYQVSKTCRQILKMKAFDSEETLTFCGFVWCIKLVLMNMSTYFWPVQTICL